MNFKDHNRIDLLISLIFFIITSLGLLIRKLHFTDKLLKLTVDSQSNICGVIVCSFLFIWWSRKSSLSDREKIVISVGIGLIIYEFIQILIPWQTFDINDILATLIGVIVASLINLLLYLLKNTKFLIR